MDGKELEKLVEAANRDLTSSLRNRDIHPVGKGTSSAPLRFELYHAALSLCSHKVRMAFAEKGLSYRSHEMNLMAHGNAIPENYRPSYVRLRLAGLEAPKLVTCFTGPGNASGFPGMRPGCCIHDIDGDGDVDLLDYAGPDGFLRRLTGPLGRGEHLGP